MPGKKDNLILKEWQLVLALFILCILAGLPLLKYPIVGDVPLYAESSENIFRGFYGYERGEGTEKEEVTEKEIKYETDVPPAFPFAAAITLRFLDHSVIAVRATSIIFYALCVSLAYIISRKISFKGVFLSRNEAIIAAIIVATNPLFFYFTNVISGTESISVFFFTLSLLLFWFRKEKIWYYALMGLVFGIYTMTRVPALIIISPFVVYIIVETIRKRENIIGKIMFFLISGSFAGWWLARSYVLAKAAPAGLYTQAYSGTHATAASFFAMLAKLFFLASPMVLLFATPLMIYAAYKSIKFLFEKNVKENQNRWFWTLCIISFFFWIIALSTFTPNETIMRARQLVPFVPIFTIMGILFMKESGGNIFRIVKKIAVVAVVVNIILLSWLNYGLLKDVSDEIFPMKTIYPQASYHRAKAINWINENTKTPLVVGVFGDVVVEERINLQFDQYINGKYFVVQNQREVSEQPRLKSIFDDEKGAHEIYAISEFGIDETSKKIAEELKEKGGKIRITGVYKGKTNIYKLEVIT
jgi:hypothetical protein